MNMLEAKALRKRYGDVTALESLNLTIGAGEVYCLLGANGAGKTTTIRIALGFQSADAGEIRIGGHSLPGQLEAARRLTAYIPEQVNLYPRLSGIENLDYFSRLAGKRQPRAALEERLSNAGLAPTAFDRRVETYSKGMRQKVGIAIALAKDARLLLMDEPTSGLDPTAANELTETIRAVASQGVSVLMATHDIFRAHQLARRLGILARGRLVAEYEVAKATLAEIEADYLNLAEQASKRSPAGASA